jgi:hypothetical protein
VEVEGPVLADEVVSEAVLGLLVDKDEPEVFVDPAGGHQVVGGPRGHAPVAGRAGEGEGLLDEPDAENHAAGSRSDEQDAQLGHARLVGGDQEHAAGAFTVDPGDPGRLLVRGVLGRVVADDLGHQRLEVGAEAELAAYNSPCAITTSPGHREGRHGGPRPAAARLRPACALSARDDRCTLLTRPCP